MVGDGDSAATAACAEDIDSAAAIFNEDVTLAMAAREEAAGAADAEEEAAGAAASIDEDEALAMAAREEADAAAADAEEEAGAAAEEEEAIAAARLAFFTPGGLLEDMMVLKVDVEVCTVVELGAELDAELGCAHVSSSSSSPSLFCTLSGQMVLALPSRPLKATRHTPPGRT